MRGGAIGRQSGVRIKALEALQGFEQDPEVLQTLVGALQNDDNSGARVEAIHLLFNALRAEASSGRVDPKILAVLRDRLRNDPITTFDCKARPHFGIERRQMMAFRAFLI